uniref:Uncharacterized protein n=1 Tax=Rhizophora mucronata TaxID=61149 RepID=A0A2P2NM90_RHIMU
MDVLFLWRCGLCFFLLILGSIFCVWSFETIFAIGLLTYKSYFATTT